MKKVLFCIPGEPMAKQRPRTSKDGHMYTPAPTVQYENLIKTIYLNLKSKEFWDNEPLQMTIVALFPIPSSYTKPKQRQCELGYIAPSRRDVDNITKIVCDALNGIAYSDDRHICQLEVVKSYTTKNNQVGVYVYMRDYVLSNLPELIVKQLKENEQC